jgi:endonuclease YncB( thermonuclease family)
LTAAAIAIACIWVPRVDLRGAVAGQSALRGATAQSAQQAVTQAELKSLVGRTVNGRVLSVTDGDTIRVRLDSGKTVVVRFQGIDTPEYREPFSTAARNATRVMMLDRIVALKGMDVDPYSRLVARVIVPATAASPAGAADPEVDASVELVSQGLACHFLRYSSDPVLAAAERTARDRGRGFWAADAPRPACVAENAAYSSARGRTR